MDFDTIFSVLFFAVIILFQVVPALFKKKQGETGETDTADSGPKGLLAKIAAHLKQEMEAARLAANSANSEPDPGWGKIMQPPPERPAVVVTSATIPEEVLLDDLLEENIAALATPPKTKATKERTTRNTTRAEPPRSLSRRRSYPLKELRQAIIWSEIIAPPLALRKDE